MTDPFMLDLFRAELAGYARALDDGLAAIDADVEGQSLEPLARAAHSIKGAARMIGLDLADRLAHEIENTLRAAQAGKVALSAGCVRNLREASGLFVQLASSPPEAIPGELAAQQAAIEPLLADMIGAGRPVTGHGGSASTDLSLLDLFRLELETHARALEEGLVALEGDPSARRIEPLMRAAHSIKGAARMVGVEPVVKLAHAMEDVLAAAQRGGGSLDSDRVDLLLAANDVFARLASLKPDQIADEVARRSDLIEAQAEKVAGCGNGARESSPARAGAASSGELGTAHRAGPAHSPPAGAADCAGRIARDGLVVRSASGPPPAIDGATSGPRQMLGSDRHSVGEPLPGVLPSPPVGGATTGPERIPRRHGCSPTESTADGATAVPAETTARSARPAAMPQAAAGHPAPRPTNNGALAGRDAPPDGQTPSDDALVRVFAHNLNRLIGLSGECLVQAESLKPLSLSLRRIKSSQAELAGRIDEALEALRNGRGDDAQMKLEDALRHAEAVSGMVPRHIAEFELFSHRLERTVNRLYSEAVSSRMRPFSDGLQGFARMVRGLARNLGKIVRFEIDGASTGVDRDILEKLEAPLTHLLRNAVDHGIETPDARRAAGKPEDGRLTLSARHSSGMLVIAVSDDGAGIDCERLRTRVVEKGYVAPDVARALGNSELMEFLFLPGFTTCGHVTEVSGRGVGLDVVQSMARAVGGSVRVESTPGAGTTFQLQLPLTLSVLRSLLFDVAGELYAVPLARIDRVIRLQHEDALLVEDRQFCKFEGGNVGIIDARQVLSLSAAAAGAPELNIIVLSDRLDRYGMVVDRFAGERDLVVVPLDPRLGKSPNLSAGAILEDGSPVLILDVEDVVRSIDNLLTRGRVEKVGRPESNPRRETKRILVVDDSLTVREVERRMLETRGYEVVVAVDGMDGWNAIQTGNFDLLVTDVDMPRMDGFELVRLVRGTPRLAGLPVMIVSYKDQEEYRIRGLESGANHYLTKSSFHEEGLFTAVRDLIGEP